MTPVESTNNGSVKAAPAKELGFLPDEDTQIAVIEPDSPVREVAIGQIVANRQQPRTEFDEEKLAELTESVKKHGVLQPLVVTPAKDGRYELVAGERRWRAARKAGLQKVPVIIRENLNSQDMLELALIENIQRDDLNAIEEAKSYQSLIEQFDYTQDRVAERMGKSRAAVANSLRLLQLPKTVQDDVMQGRMTAGHARALLAIGDLQEQLTLREMILREQLTVRDVEGMIQARKGAKPKVAAAGSQLSPQLRLIVDEMAKTVGTKVNLKRKSDKSGVVQIEYYSLQDLDKIYRRIMGS